MKLFSNLLVVLVILSFGAAGWAEDKPSAPGKTDVLSTDLFWMALGINNLEYEHALNNGSSFALRVKSGEQDLTDWKWTLSGGGASYRGYFGNEAPDGGYYGLGLDMLMIDAEQTTLSAKGDSTFIVPRLELGYQSVSDMGLTFAVGLDVDFYSGSLKVGSEEFPLSGFGGGLRLSLGFAW